MPGRSDWPEVIPIPEATEQFLSPDVATTTRIDFTDFFMRFRHAEDAHSAYKHLFVKYQQLIKLLIEHPAMKPNLQQTFNTPANSKNKIYFMWDFVLRTFQFLAARVDPRNPVQSPMFIDVLSRSTQARELIVDTTGMLDKMNASVGYKIEKGTEFTDEIKELAKTLDHVHFGCAGCGKSKREDGRPLLQCARCKDDQYCSTECQKKEWKKHKKVCKPA